MRQTIDAPLLANMFLCGAKSVELNKEYINELNVFPVPDGDTGTNMTLTVLSAVEEIKGLSRIQMKELCKAISSGSLRGARGNSGVILSQLLRGFTKAVRDLEELDITTIAAAFVKAQETAYKAVMKPKEGTILTVAREIAEKATEMAGSTEDIDDFFRRIIVCGEESLSHTPELLPVLKEAGVVDSGGQGLLEFLRGAYEGYQGKEVSFGEDEKKEEEKFSYSTEFVIDPGKDYSKEAEQELKAYLNEIGDSIVIMPDGDYIKIHVNTDSPGLAIQKGLELGAIVRANLDNLKEVLSAAKDTPAQPSAQEAKEPAEKEIGFIAVSSGEGLNTIFKELGADCVITGGQTMNPSTDDILKALDSINAKHVFVFPNNKNIVLAANQAKAMADGRDLIVVPTCTIPQGITALISYMPDSSAEENEVCMKEAIEAVKSGQVTYAIRTTQIDGREIHEGDFMGISDEGILASGNDLQDVTEKLIDAMTDEDSCVITIYYGEDTSGEEAEALTAKIAEKYPDAEVECHSGGQPVYRYLISVE